MACLAYAYTAEVYGQDIECGIGGSLKEAGETPYEGVGSVGGHGIDHEATGTATAQRLHERGGQSTYKLGVAAQSCHTPGNAVDGCSL